MWRQIDTEVDQPFASGARSLNAAPTGVKLASEGFQSSGTDVFSLSVLRGARTQWRRLVLCANSTLLFVWASIARSPNTAPSGVKVGSEGCQSSGTDVSVAAVDAVCEHYIVFRVGVQSRSSWLDFTGLDSASPNRTGQRKSTKIPLKVA